MAANSTDDPATIQQEVERTQDAIGETVDKIEAKLSPRNFTQSLLGEEHANTAQEAWEVVRESPLPVAMIAGGAAWLLATSQAPMISRMREQLKSRFRNAFGSSDEPARPTTEHPAPIGPPPATGEAFDRRAAERR